MIRVVCLFAAISAAAQEHPVQLYRGMGLHTHPIATTNAEAQKYFDQGLVLLYGFNRYEAHRSFQKAADLDPQAIMPRWGLAASLAPHINMDLDGDVDLKKACAIGTEALKLDGPANEKGYIRAAAALCQGEAAHRQAMRALHLANPDDLDAATLFAETLMVPVRWRWWQMGRPSGEMATSIRTLESVLKRDPDHPGANHFYVHAMEMSPNPEYALPSAQRLMGGIAPGAGHLVHMAGHIYLRTGDYEIVASSNERAVQVDEDYFHHSHVQGGYMGYYAHNIHFIVTARMMQGRYEDAYQNAVKMIDVAKPLIELAPAIVDALIPTPTFVRLRFHKWDELLAQALTKNPKLPATNAIEHYARALAFLGKGQRAEAIAEQTLFETQRKAIPAAAPWINNKASVVLNLAAATLQARLAPNDRAAIPHWKIAVQVQDTLVYDEPPPWFYPVRESLGSALLRAGDAKAAEAVFREDLRRTPRNGRSLFGLWQSLEKQSRTSDAAWVKSEFEKTWKKSQIQLRIEDL